MRTVSGAMFIVYDGLERRGWQRCWLIWSLYDNLSGWLKKIAKPPAWFASCVRGIRNAPACLYLIFGEGKSARNVSRLNVWSGYPHVCVTFLVGNVRRLSTQTVFEPRPTNRDFVSLCHGLPRRGNSVCFIVSNLKLPSQKEFWGSVSFRCTLQHF